MSSSLIRLRQLGWNAAVEQRFASYRRSHQPARVCCVDDAGADMAGGSGAIRATYGGALLCTAAGDATAWPVPGDWVAVRDWPDDRVTLEAVLRRSTLLLDADGGVTAANVDVVMDAGGTDLASALASGQTVAVVGSHDAVSAAVRGVLRDAMGPGTMPLPRRESATEAVAVPGGGVVVAVPDLEATWSLVAARRPA